MGTQQQLVALALLLRALSALNRGHTKLHGKMYLCTLSNTFIHIHKFIKCEKLFLHFKIKDSKFHLKR